jgi:putative AlgH/UPF0301 family transcriptional regulator
MQPERVPSSRPTSQSVQDLIGQLLVAHPGNPDDELAHAVIYVASVETDRVIGLQINQIYTGLELGDVCERLGIGYTEYTPVYRSGNQGTRRIHVIHDPSWTGITTLTINSDISITNDISVLAALSADSGPEYFRACAGHWNWSTETLERQLHDQQGLYRWITVPASRELMFDSAGDDQWRACIRQHVRQEVQRFYCQI